MLIQSTSTFRLKDTLLLWTTDNTDSSLIPVQTLIIMDSRCYGLSRLRRNSCTSLQRSLGRKAAVHVNTFLRPHMTNCCWKPISGMLFFIIIVVVVVVDDTYYWVYLPSTWIDLYFLFHFEAIIVEALSDDWVERKWSLKSSILFQLSGGNSVWTPLIEAETKYKNVRTGYWQYREKKDSPLHQVLNVMLCLRVACTACSFFNYCMRYLHSGCLFIMRTLRWMRCTV